MSEGSFGIIVVVIYAVVGYGVTNASGVAALMFGILCHLLSHIQGS